MAKAKATTAAKKTTAAPKKVIAKKSAAKKASKTAAPKAATKKQPVAPKVASSRKQQQTLDLCLILDCTYSMHSWIERSKDTLREIIDHVKNTNAGLAVKVGFVAYRNFRDRERFEVTDFTDDIAHVK